MMRASFFRCWCHLAGAALALWAGVAASTPIRPLGQACLVVSGLSAQQQFHCMTPDSVLELQDLARLRGVSTYTVDELRVPKRGVIFLSDEPGLKGRLWRVENSAKPNRLAALGIPRTAIASAMLVPMACAYEHGGFSGRERCFASGQTIGQITALDRKISSLRLSPQVSVRTYAEEQERGRMTYFNEDADLNILNAMGLNDAIRSMQVARYAFCVGRCLIPGTDAYDIRNVFGASWAPDTPGAREPQIALPLEIGPETGAVIRYGNLVLISHANGISGVYFNDSRLGPLTLPRNPRVRYLTVAMSFSVGRWFGVQLIRSDAERRYIDATAISMLPWPAQSDQVVTVLNASRRGALVLDNASASLARPPISSVSRDKACDTRPILSSAVGKLLPCAGQTSADPSRRPLRTAAVLTQYFVDNRDPLAMSAAARVCRVPVERILGMSRHRTFAPRKVRVIGNWEVCADRVITIIMLYRTLFPDGWNFSQYRTVIHRVLGQGPVERRAGTEAQEAEFAAAVRRQTEAEDTRYADAILAFHQANIMSVYSLSAGLDLEPLATDPAELGAVACTRWRGTPGTPPTATQSLGWYRLDMGDYVERMIFPYVRRNGISTISHEPFISRIVTRANPDDITALRIQMYRWEQRFIAALLPATSPDAASNRSLAFPDTMALPLPSSQCEPERPETGQEFLAAAGYSMTQGIDDALRHANANNVFVAIFLRGQPVAILFGSVPQDGSTEAEVSMLVSAPDNVLDPNRDGGIRGAGAAALNTFVQYARSHDMTAVRAQAISGPATRMKKAGFRMVDEL